MKNLICLIAFICFGFTLSTQPILIDDFSVDQALLFAMDGNINTFQAGNLEGKIILKRDGSIEKIVFSDPSFQLVQDSPENIERKVRDAAAKSDWANNLKQIGIAIHGTVQNRSGKPMKVASSNGKPFSTSAFSINQTFLFSSIKGVLLLLKL